MRVPYSLIPEKRLLTLARSMQGLGELIKPFFPYLELNLRQSEAGVTAREYLSMSMIASTIFFFLILIISLAITYTVQMDNYFLFSIIVSIVISFFVFAQQTLYPKLISSRRIKDIDRNLLPAIRTLLIHINSGIPLFDSIVGIANQNYGAVSLEFKKIIKKINSGVSASTAIEESATNNPSTYYRRALWQISNGLKAGSNVSLVLQETLNNLSSEQSIQIEHYGSQLSPLAMFYMIMAVIVPALSMTMLIILSSFVSLDVFFVKLVFYAIYALVLLFQIMFLGMIKTRRPNLLGI